MYTSMCKRIKNRLETESYNMRVLNSWRDMWLTSPYLTHCGLTLFRGSSGLFWLVWTLYDLTRDRFMLGGRHWAFFTNWVIFLIGVYFVTASLTVFYLQIRKEIFKLPCIGKLTWVLLNILIGPSISITLLYWLLYYNGESLQFKFFIDHGLGAGWVLVDVLLTYNPLYFKHVYQSMLFSLVYFIFLALYDFVLAKSQSNIYDFVDWSNNPGEAGVKIFGFIFISVPLFHFLAALLKPQMESNNCEKFGKGEDCFL